MKSPPALALVLVVMAVTVPPCGHIMTLDELRRLAISLHHFQCAIVHIHFGIGDFYFAATPFQSNSGRI